MSEFCLSSISCEFVDFDQILYMCWYWQDIDLDDWKIIFRSFSTELLPLIDFIYAQYLVDQLIDFDKIL